ncbi:MAG: PqqD family protein [Bacteroidetes bacterium]|nr:PqqD family protein [Bacteroidota bacterium]
MIDLNSVVIPSPDIVPRKTGDEYVLVPVSNNIADMDSVYTLNETGAFIWERLDGKSDLASIIRCMQSEFEVDAETAKSDLLSFISEMKQFLIING